MITEHGSDWYRRILRRLDACRCRVCERGTAAKVRRIIGEDPPQTPEDFVQLVEEVAG